MTSRWLSVKSRRLYRTNRQIKLVFIAISALILYFVAWNLIISFNLIPANFGSGSAGGSNNIGLGENTEILVYRYSFVPIYWSRLGGDLTLYHIIFLTALIVGVSGAELINLAKTQKR